MNVEKILIAALILSLFVETTLFALPFVFTLIIGLYILNPSIRTIVIGIVAGFILDSLKLSSAGITPVVILLSFIVIEILRNFFELKDYKIVLATIAIAAFIYAEIFQYKNNIILYVIVFGLIWLITYYLHSKTKWLK